MWRLESLGHYRARQVDELFQLQVVRLGTRRPARVLVQFVDDAFEGREEGFLLRA